MICVFDIETIPDVTLIRKIFGFEGDDREVSLLAMSDQEAKSGNSFLPLPFHKVVAISAVIADDFGIFRKVSSIEGKDEKEMIKNFLNFINQKNPKLISFNGRSFDMPLLMLRAMQYNLTCNAYFEVDNNELGKSKWENYRTRFSNRFHVDVMDHLCEFGAVRGLKLDLVCSMVGLPGKYDVHGDQVMELFYAGEIEKIKEYCESDVLNTYWLFLKYEVLKGNMTIEDYQRALATMQENLRPEKSYTDVFGIAIEDELYKEE